MDEICMISKPKSLNHWSEEWKYHGIQHSHVHLTYPVNMDMSPYHASSDEFTWTNLGLEFYRRRIHLLVPRVLAQNPLNVLTSFNAILSFTAESQGLK